MTTGTASATRLAGVGALAAGLLALATWNLGQPSRAVETEPSGAQLFHAKGCAACHTGPDSTAPMSASVPSLADAGTWAATRRPPLSARDYLTESILTPGAFISPEFRGGAGPMTYMPRLRVAAEEVDALVDYLLDDRVGAAPTEDD